MAGKQRWSVRASVGNGRGVFDAAYTFGEEQEGQGNLCGTTEEVGAALTTYLKGLGKDDMDAMRYGTPVFYLELIVEPIGQTPLDDLWPNCKAEETA